MAVQKLHVRDAIAEKLTTNWNREIQKKIEDQIELKGERLREKDKYLLENSRDDMETTRGESQ